MSILAAGKYTADTAGAVIEMDQSQHYRSSWDYADKLVTRYEVPADTYCTLQRVHVTAFTPFNISTASNTLTRMGIVYLQVGGVDKFEAQITGDALPGNVNSGEELVPDCHQQRFDFGDGFIVPASTAITVRVDQTSATSGCRWNASIYGVQGGVVRILKGAVIPSVNTTQNILTDTPAADFTVLGMTIHCECFGFLIGRFDIRLNGQIIFESNLLGMDDSQANFDDDDVDGPGVFSLPLEGIILREGDRLEVLAAPVSANNSVFYGQITGDETTIDTGGGGSAIAHFHHDTFSA